MKFNKKGTAASEMWAPDTILFWIIFGIVLGFVAVVFVLIISKSSAEKAKIYENLESLYLMQRFFKSPDCFIYDKEGNIRSSVIDFDKFNDERLNSCYKISGSILPAFRITLSSDVLRVSKSIKTSNWNDNRDYEEKITPKNIAIYYQNKMHKGKIEIEIQNLR